MSPGAKRFARRVGTFAAYGLLSVLVSAPVAAEQAVETIRFDDRIGAVPVEISLTHNGISTLDTGVLGRLYWEETGAGGFGAYVRVTGTPEAGGTLSSYLSPRFVRTNVAFVNDPDAVAEAYGAELRTQFWHRFLLSESAAFLLGGLLLTAVFRGGLPPVPGGRRRTAITLGALAVVAAVGSSTLIAMWLFSRWEGNVEVSQSYPMPGIDALSFSSPQTLEVARQVQPFIEKNSARIRARTEEYEAAAVASLTSELADRSSDLAPASGERILIAEADPQGSIVGTAVRRELYALLVEALGEDTFIARTISGDITSNGTVAESSFVEQEAVASDEIPVVVVKGDHDTETTVEQLTDNDVANPDFDLTEINGTALIAANDPAFKTLFGGLVINDSGISEFQRGEDLRDDVDGEDGPMVVLVHQPATAAGYIGVDSLHDLDEAVGRETTPWEDDIPDLPAGIINVGHLHDTAAPKVIWNTDGDEVTWTVVNQLGTAGGVEEHPTYNRFSTPFSAPLKALSVQLQYIDTDTGLQTGYLDIDIATDGTATIGERTDLGISID